MKQKVWAGHPVALFKKQIAIISFSYITAMNLCTWLQVVKSQKKLWLFLFSDCETTVGPVVPHYGPTNKCIKNKIKNKGSFANAGTICAYYTDDEIYVTLCAL